ncbi:phosphoribosylaminoimidazole carboxylase [Polaribacter sp.]|uniref:phosphoribosylaminoimidazole carboxylase n=1 Tax=Polaribacter sp. TaxID=1920175 RepID=UPI003EF5F7F9
MIKKALLFIALTIFFSCTDNTTLANCLPNLQVSVTTDLNNPGVINANVPGGFAIINGGSKGILLLNVNGNDFVAYDRICPENDCTSPMEFKNGFILQCTCDDSQYGVGSGIGGAPQTAGFNCWAREYKVTKNGSVIRISNF